MNLAIYYNNISKGSKIKYFLQKRDEDSGSVKGRIQGMPYVQISEHRSSVQLGCVYFNRYEDAEKAAKILGEHTIKILIQGLPK